MLKAIIFLNHRKGLWSVLLYLSYFSTAATYCVLRAIPQVYRSALHTVHMIDPADLILRGSCRLSSGDCCSWQIRPRTHQNRAAHRKSPSWHQMKGKSSDKIDAAAEVGLMEHFRRGIPANEACDADVVIWEYEWSNSFCSCSCADSAGPWC